MRDAVKPREQMVVGEDRGDQRAIALARAVVDRGSVEQDSAGFRNVQAGEDLQKCRFARAVAAGDEHQIAGLEGEIHGPDLESRLRRLVEIAVNGIVLIRILVKCFGMSADAQVSRPRGRL